jgi:hypothetical protein
MTITKDDNKAYDDIGELTAEDLFADIYIELTGKKEDIITSGKFKESTTQKERLFGMQSQKADDLIKVDLAYKGGSIRWKPLPLELILLDDTIDVVDAAFGRILPECEDGETAFLRACPEFARHGVLESIKVTKETLQEEWISLSETMKKEDPRGCMILQPFVHATSSAVLAPQQFATIGKGHDGITAGNERTLYFALNPCQTYMSNDINMINNSHEFDIKTGTTNYELEFVYKRDEEYKKKMGGGNEPYITQIRASPPNPPRAPPFTWHTNVSCPNYKVEDVNEELDCPDNTCMKVAKITGSAGPTGRCEAKDMTEFLSTSGIASLGAVWTATGLEEVAWLEENITRDKCPDGFVISHPTGSLMSHICAHARQHSIPYVVGEVNVGDRFTEGSPTWLALDPNWDIVPQPYNACCPEYIEAFKAGLRRSQTHYQRQQGWFAHFFHQWAGGMNYNGVNDAYLSGAFVGWMTKAILALSLGEMRYSKGHKKNMMVDVWPTLTAMMGVTKWEEVSGNKHAGETRQHYYALVEQMNIDTTEIGLALNWCKKQFATGWGSNTSYGGTNWGECASRGAAVCRAVDVFLDNPCSDTLNELMGEVNLAKNLEHNGGFLYNKFLSKKAFDYSSIHVDDAGEKSGLFSHSPDSLAYMFRTYELASELMDGEANEKNAAPNADWVTLFTFLKGKGVSYYRQNFIAHSNEIPEALRDAAVACGPKYMHYTNKYSTSEGFVPCGMTTCKLCKENDVLVMDLKYGGASSQLLTNSYPEVFMAGGKNISSLDSYAVASLLREKKYQEVTPQMWINGWNGLNKLDVTYPLLSELLSKFLRNQMSDDNNWTDTVLKVLKEEGQ